MKIFIDMKLVELEKIKGRPLRDDDYIFPYVIGRKFKLRKKMNHSTFIDLLNK